MVPVIDHTDSLLAIQDRCRLAGVPRSSYYRLHQRRQTPADPVVQEVRQLCAEYPRYGYRRVSKQLQRQGLQVNHMEFTPFNGHKVKPGSDVIVQKPPVTCNRATSGGALGCKTLRDTQRSVCELLPVSESVQRTHALS